jgi:hypothetical protein
VAESIRRAVVVGDARADTDGFGPTGARRTGPDPIGAVLAELGLVVDVVAVPDGEPSPGTLRAEGIRPRWDWDDDAGHTVARADLVRLVGHVRAWRAVVAGDEPVLVVDRGAVATPALADALGELPAPDGPDGWDAAALATVDAAAPWSDDVRSAAALVVTPRAAAVLLARAAEAALPVDHHVAGAGLDLVTDDRGAVVAPPGRARVSATSHLVVVNGPLLDGAAAVRGDDHAVVAWIPAPSTLVGDRAALLAAWAAAGGDVVVASAPAGAVGRACIGPIDRLVELGVLPSRDAGAPRARGGAAVVDPATVLDAAVRRGAALDHDAVVFQTVGTRPHGLVALGGRVRAASTGLEPPVLVAVDDGPAAAARIGDLAAASADPGDRDLVRLFAYVDAVDDDPGWEVVAPEIVRVPFWTPAFCATVVRAAFAADVWDQDPDDPVPGREVSLAALSPRLFAHVEDHVGHCVVPVLRAVWPEMAWCGLQDAFVICYTPGPDAGLRLHHDVAQVSASVRLADDHDGGELEFPRQEWTNRDVPLGHLVAWPSLVTHPHRAAPVTAGCKVGLTIWFRLPPA